MKNEMIKKFEEMIDMLKVELLNDNEFLSQLRDKLGTVSEVIEPKEEQLEDCEEPNEKFVMTNSDGEALIDTDDLNVNVEDEEELNEVMNENYSETEEEHECDCDGNCGDQCKCGGCKHQQLEDEAEEDEYEDSIDLTSFSLNESKQESSKSKFAEATEADLEGQTDVEEIELTEEQLIEMIKEQLGEENLEDMDIDLGNLLQQIKLAQQQEPNYKFMERSVDEYNSIIDSTFAGFPSDLGGNDELI